MNRDDRQELTSFLHWTKTGAVCYSFGDDLVGKWNLFYSTHRFLLCIMKCHILLIWWFVLTNFQIQNLPCISEMKFAWLSSLIILLIQRHTDLPKAVGGFCVSMKHTGLQLFFLIMPYSDFVLRVFFSFLFVCFFPERFWELLLILP